MEEESNERLPKRKFGYLKIEWEIENSFCVTNQDKWHIYSPFFSVNGFFPIKWRFILEAYKFEGQEKYVDYIYLQRQEDVAREYWPVSDTSRSSLSLQVFWNLSCGTVSICKNSHTFPKPSGRERSRISDFEKLCKRLQDIHTRKLNIDGIVLVTSSEDNVAFGSSNDIGLKGLSDNFVPLCFYKRWSDLTIKSLTTSVAGHKAILSARSKVLDDKINEDRGDISVEYSDEASTENVLSYLYTGNLGFVLQNPSISIHEAIQYFGVQELEKYYLKDEIRLRTNYVVQEFCHKWIIMDLKKLSNSTSNFADRNLNIQLTLGLHENTSGGFGIFVRGFVPLEWREVFIAFEIINVLNQVALKRKVRWTREHDDQVGIQVGIENVLSRDIANEVLTTAYEELRISCYLFIPNSVDDPYLAVTIIRDSLPSYIDAEEHYTQFSKKIESLLDSGKYSDLIISCGEEIFRVHKCILSARSPVFEKSINSLSTTLTVYGVDPDTLRIVLRYIYSGVLKDFDFPDGRKIYQAAMTFEIQSLIPQTGTLILRDDLRVSNVFDSLFLAYYQNETRLKLAAFKFLMYNRSQMDPDTWESLRNKRDVYEEFIEYVIRHIRNNPNEGILLEHF